MPQESELAYTVRPARKIQKDAEGIAKAYQSAYDGNYPFPAFTIPEQVIENVIPSEDHTLVVEVEPGQRVNGDTLQSKEVAGTGSVKFHRDNYEAELGGIVLHQDFQELEAPIYEELVDERRRKAENSQAQRYITNPVSSTHAKTQHGHSKKGAIPEGVSLNKYPEIFKGEGRETVVPMVYPGSNLEAEEEQVYLTDQTIGICDYVLSRFEESDEANLEREINIDNGEKDSNYQYSVKQKLLNEEIGMAQFQVTPEGDQELDEAMREINEAVNNSEVQWIGVEMDANHSSAHQLTNSLTENGFKPERYSPAALNYTSKPRDSLSMQYIKQGTGTIQLIGEAVNALESTNIDYRDEGNGPVPNVQRVSID